MFINLKFLFSTPKTIASTFCFVCESLRGLKARLLNTITEKHSMVSDLHVLKLQVLLEERNMRLGTTRNYFKKKKRGAVGWKSDCLAYLAESQVQSTFSWSHTPEKHVSWNTNTLLEGRVVFHKRHLKMHLVKHCMFFRGKISSQTNYQYKLTPTLYYIAVCCIRGWHNSSMSNFSSQFNS